MRRILPAALQTGPVKEKPTSAAARSAKWAWSVCVELECVTPVVGGGVEAYVPDSVDFVRVPGIRGRLRQFWRALEPEPISAGELFEKESALWGGVSGEEQGGRRSRVEITVKVLPESRVREYPAGWHEPRRNGGVSALPTWLSRDLGYALFPLQRSRKELEAEGNTMPRVPTKMVREGLRFELRLRLAWPDKLPDSRSGGERLVQRETLAAESRRLLGALLCWIYLGGLGGRTTRGFGALMVCRSSVEDLDPPCRDEWQELLRGPKGANDVGNWLTASLTFAGLGTAGEGGRFGWATLHDVEYCAGPPQATAQAAHGMMVKALQAFRQGAGVGRNPGRERNRPGRSRWPEADVMKRSWKRLNRTQERWEHPPASSTVEDCAPRAAFGLPIVLSFKDRYDSRANAILNPGDKGARRWASPVLLRPMRCAKGQKVQWVPLIVVLTRRPGRTRKDPGGHGEQPHVELSFTDRKPLGSSDLPRVPIRGSSGAQPPIADYLKRCRGDAVDAFLSWLSEEHRFTRSRGDR